MIRIAVTTTLFLCLTLPGPALTDTPPEESSRDDCFYIRNINGWDAIDRDHVYLKQGVNDHYLVTLFSSCPGLKFANAIALSNHSGRMCPNDFGSITYRDAGMARTCRIDNVERVTSKDEAVALAESRGE